MSLSYAIKFRIVHTFAVPAIPDPVNCKWNDWVLGSCSQACGEGTRNKTRSQLVAAEHGGTHCDGPSNIEENCTGIECPGRILSDVNLFPLCIA